MGTQAAVFTTGGRSPLTRVASAEAILAEPHTVDRALNWCKTGAAAIFRVAGSRLYSLRDTQLVPTADDVRHRLPVFLGTTNETVVRHEFWLPCSNQRADLVEVNGRLSAFEVKGSRDTLRRLPRQVESYGQVFDQCTLVVSENHRERASRLIPAWWGCIVFDSEGDEVRFRRIKEPDPNPAVDARVVVRLLWRAEVEAALGELGLVPAPGAGRVELWEALLAGTNDLIIRTIVRRALRLRSYASDGGRFRTRL